MDRFYCSLQVSPTCENIAYSYDDEPAGWHREADGSGLCCGPCWRAVETGAVTVTRRILSDTVYGVEIVRDDPASRYRLRTKHLEARTP